VEKSNDSLIKLVERHKKVVDIIYEVSEKVNTSLDLETIFDSTFQLLDTYFNFKHIMILLVDEQDDQLLRVCSSHGYKGQGIGMSVAFGKGIIGSVAKHKKLLRMNNLFFNRIYVRAMADSTEMQELPGIPDCKSTLAVPLVVQNHLVGVIAIESPIVAVFDKKDEELLKLLGIQIGIAINNANQFNEIQKANQQLQDLNETLEQKVVERTEILVAQNEQIQEQHTALQQEQNNTQRMLIKIETLFGQQVSKDIVNELITTEGDLARKEYEVTVLFLDIRDFSVYADITPTTEVARFQNIIFGELISIINKHHGMTTQILGDGLMVVFGAPVVAKKHAQNAVNAGFEILEKVSDLAVEGRIPKIKLGIGLHSGKVIAGNLGNAHRKQYSLTGTTVIIAARIEQLNKTYDSEFLISESVRDKLDVMEIPMKALGKVHLKGIENPHFIFRLL